MKGEYSLKSKLKFIKNKYLTKNTLLYLLIILILAIFIFICNITKKYSLPTFDLTESKLFSISDLSTQNLQNLKYDVFIYFFGNNMSEDLSIYGIAQKYNKINSKIRTEVIIPSENPEFCEKYGLSTNNSAIIIKSANENYKILRMSDFYTTDYITNSTIDLTEEKLTNAILDVQIQNKLNVYFLSGHSESTNLELLKYYIENELYNVKSLEISKNENKVPDDCNCLIIATPQVDFTDADFIAVSEYVNSGGNIIYLDNKNTTSLANVQKLLDLYGAKLSGNIITEPSYIYNLSNDPNTLIATLSSHVITNNIISDGYIALVNPTKLEVLDDSKLSSLGVTANIFMKSSYSSLLKDISDSDTTKIIEASDSYNIGGEFIKKVNDTISSKLILIGNSTFVSDNMTINEESYPGVSVGNNKDLILNSISYLTNKSYLSIRKSTPIINVLSTDNNVKAGFAVIIIFIIPILILSAGIIVWIVRQRKK